MFLFSYLELNPRRIVCVYVHICFIKPDFYSIFFIWFFLCLLLGYEFQRATGFVHIFFSTFLIRFSHERITLSRSLWYRKQYRYHYSQFIFIHYFIFLHLIYFLINSNTFLQWIFSKLGFNEMTFYNGLQMIFIRIM